jgi:hypothetical protein
MTEELFATDAYRRSFDAAVVATDRDAGRVALDRTAFTRVAAVSRRPRHRGLGRRAGRGHSREAGGGRIWHCLDAHELPGGNIEPGSERLDFPLESISAELGRRLENRINEELAAARAVVVGFLGRAVATPTPRWSGPRRTRSQQPTPQDTRLEDNRRSPRRTPTLGSTIRRCDDRLSPGSTPAIRYANWLLDAGTVASMWPPTGVVGVVCGKHGPSVPLAKTDVVRPSERACRPDAGPV